MSGHQIYIKFNLILILYLHVSMNDFRKTFYENSLSVTVTITLVNFVCTSFLHNFRVNSYVHISDVNASIVLLNFSACSHHQALVFFLTWRSAKTCSIKIELYCTPDQ